MAKKEGVAGWHSMRKEELIKALASASRKTKRQTGKSAPSTTTNGHDPKSRLLTPAQRQTRTRIDALKSRLTALKNIATSAENGKTGEKVDRLVLMVRDPYWLQAHWDLTAPSVERARTALGHNWHAARPVLRVYRVLEDGSSVFYRDVMIHGGVNHWYLDVADPPQRYRAEIGYRAGESQFYCLSRSNTVTTPIPGSTDAMNGGWSDVAENADRIFAMSGGYSERGTSLELQQLLEERLKCRLGRPTETRFGNGACGLYLDREELRFAIDCEIVIYGATSPHAHVTVEGEPVTLRSDGTFAVRLPFPDRRQVVPVVASAPDGVEQKTIILGIERNTKELEPMLRDSNHQG
jgi:hypothetical protein